MSAHADDLRNFYAEHIGESIIVAASAVAAASPQLPPGRYLLHTLNPSGISTLWARQGPFGRVQDATAAVPSTPFDMSVTPREQFVFMVRAAGKGAGAENAATDGLSFITNAGTIDVVLTRISR